MEDVELKTVALATLTLEPPVVITELSMTLTVNKLLGLVLIAPFALAPVPTPSEAHPMVLARSLPLALVQLPVLT